MDMFNWGGGGIIYIYIWVMDEIIKNMECLVFQTSYLIKVH